MAAFSTSEIFPEANRVTNDQRPRLSRQERTSSSKRRHRRSTGGRCPSRALPPPPRPGEPGSPFQVAVLCSMQLGGLVPGRKTSCLWSQGTLPVF